MCLRAHDALARLDTQDLEDQGLSPEDYTDPSKRPAGTGKAGGGGGRGRKRRAAGGGGGGGAGAEQEDGGDEDEAEDDGVGALGWHAGFQGGRGRRANVRGVRSLALHTSFPAPLSALWPASSLAGCACGHHI